jgi:general secretion pathway protein F
VPVYAYRGVSLAGRNVTGNIEADSPKSARAKLREQGILASDMRAAVETHTGRRSRVSLLSRRVSVRELSRTIRQLATLLSAGIPLVDAVTSLSHRKLAPAMATSLANIRTDLTEGMSFEAAVAKHPGVFPPLYSGMIRAGEATGALETVLHRIADHAEASARLQGQMRSAMTYPVIMMVVGGGIVTFLLAYVVPQVTRVFLEANQTLPLPTRMMMAFGEFAAAWGLQLALVGASGLLGLRYAWTTETGGRRIERIALALPWFGEVQRNVAMARLCHTLSTLVAGGMPLVESLRVSRDVTSSRLVADVLDLSANAVSEGEPLAPKLGKSGLFNPMVVDMIAVGERSGDLENMLSRAAEALDEEVSANIETMTGLVEPIMILFMAGVVLLVILAILLPVFEMNQLVR